MYEPGRGPGEASALEEAAPAHVASVRRHLVDRLDPEELAALGRIAEKIADDPPGCP